MQKQKWSGRLVRLSLSFLVFFVLMEIASSLLIHETADGQRIFGDLIRLKPYHMPIHATQKIIDSYLASDASLIIYDSQTGWVHRPHASDGLYRFNSDGLRANKEYSRVPDPSGVRIAVFGDSFIRGDEVGLEESWAYQLGGLLNDAAIRAEVLNFGVGGYGLDQAYLLWHKKGIHYNPDVVIVGLAAVGMLRLVNVMAPLNAVEVGIPFSKPRFILRNGRLELVNSPTLPPEQLVPALENFAESALAPYEGYYDPKDFQDHWWLKSDFVALISAIVASTRFERSGKFYQNDLNILPVNFGDDYFAREGEASQITFAILSRWQQEVEAQGGRFIVLHMPRDFDLRDADAGRPLAYEDLLVDIKERFETIDTLPSFQASGWDSSFFAPQGHYSAKGNRVVSEAVAAYLSDR